MLLKNTLKNILSSKPIKFAITSGVTTIVHLSFSAWMVTIMLPYFGCSASQNDLVYIASIAWGLGVGLNYYLQKKFVFELNRSEKKAFSLSMLVSLGGFLLNAVLVAILSREAYFQISETHKVFPIAIATVLVFFYNFYMKRIAFEGRY